MKRMWGPFSLYANEEVGILIEGFDTPPVIAMGHSRNYQAGLCEKLGLTKEKDLFCWRFERGEIPKRAVKAWEETKKLPEVRLRSIDMSNMKRDIDAIIDIYNDAWDGKWGFVPVTAPEATKIAQDFKLIIDKDISFLAEVDGKIAGMARGAIQRSFQADADVKVVVCSIRASREALTLTAAANVLFIEFVGMAHTARRKT